MSNWLKNKIRKWLGILGIEQEIRDNTRMIKDLVEIGVDVNFREQSTVIILSKLKGGQVRLIPSYFKDMNEMEQLVKGLKASYNTTKDAIFDMPFGYGGRPR